MKKYIYIFLLLLASPNTFAQQHEDDFICYHTETDGSSNLRADGPQFSGNGSMITPKGDLRALIICAGFGPQFDNSYAAPNWSASPDALPTYLLDKSTVYSDYSDFATYAGANHNTNVSRFYYGYC
jgi:hypothetical protein